MESKAGKGNLAVTQLKRIFWRPKGAAFDTERSQAIVRLIVILAIALYVAPMAITGIMPRLALHVLIGMYVFYVPYSFGLIYWISRQPGNKPLRRALTMGMDYTAMALTFSVGSASVMPLFAVLIWVTVGNGLRFGTPYLAGSTALALLVLIISAFTNDYLRMEPHLVATLAATTLVVPGYIYILQDRLQRAYKAEQEASLSKSRFLAQASHDLRQPIHAISLFTACLRDAGLQPKELQMVDNIDRSLQSVSRLFKSLLDVSTLDSGKVVPKWEIIEANEILEDVVRQNAEAAQRSGGQIRYVGSRDLIRIDRGLLTTMLQNIVNNAVKYAPGSDILIGCRRSGASLAIEIYDQGPGIDIMHQARVFEEFYQVRQRGDRDVEGVGLGLPIVQRLATLLGLHVVLRSRVGFGTQIRIEGLHLAGRERERLRQPQGAAPQQRGYSGLAGLQVLLIEDDAAVLSATANLLRRWGCEVQAELAIPGGIAPCDLLVTDYDLGGGVTGTECIEAVRARLGWHVPAVIMSGHDAARLRDDLDDPDIPILSKPVQPAELRSVLSAKALDVDRPRHGTAVHRSKAGKDKNRAL